MHIISENLTPKSKKIFVWYTLDLLGIQDPLIFYLRIQTFYPMKLIAIYKNEFNIIYHLTARSKMFIIPVFTKTYSKHGLIAKKMFILQLYLIIFFKILLTNFTEFWIYAITCF